MHQIVDTSSNEEAYRVAGSVRIVVHVNSPTTMEAIIPSQQAMHDHLGRRLSIGGSTPSDAYRRVACRFCSAVPSQPWVAARRWQLCNASRKADSCRAMICSRLHVPASWEFLLSPYSRRSAARDPIGAVTRKASVRNGFIAASARHRRYLPTLVPSGLRIENPVKEKCRDLSHRGLA